MYSLPYVLYLLFIIVLSPYESVHKQKVRVLLALSYVLFVGCSGLIGTDWFSYMPYYEETELLEWTTRDYEVGFSLIAKLCSSIGVSFYIFKLFIVTFQVILFDKIIKDFSNSYCLAYACLFALFPIAIFDLLRNFTAILIACQAIPYFEKSKNNKGYLICLLAIAFHISAIIYFVFPLLKKKINKKVLIFLLIIGLFIYFFQIKYISPFLIFTGRLLGGRIEYIINYNINTIETIGAYGVRLGIVEKIFFYVLFLFHYGKNIVHTKDTHSLIYRNLFIFYILTNLYLTEIDGLINRFSVMFCIGYILYISNMPYYFVSKVKRKIFCLIIISLLLFKTFVSYNTEIFQYSNVLFAKDKLEERINNRINHYE